MPQRWKLDTAFKIDSFNQHAVACLQAGNPATVEFVDKKRSTNQNSMIYGLYQDVAKQTGQSIQEIKRHCKLTMGVPILRAHNPDFCTFYDARIKGMSYTVKLELMDYLEVTSQFSVSQATEYIHTMLAYYHEHNVPLVDPHYANE